MAASSLTLRGISAVSASLAAIVLISALRDLADPSTPARMARSEVLLGLALVVGNASAFLDPKRVKTQWLLAGISILLSMAVVLMPR